jgi:predicted secreted protein
MSADTRKGGNGSKQSFRARFSTAGRIAPIETWLQANAKGRWRVKMESVSDDMAQKNYSILFEDEEDRDRFRSRFTLGKTAYDKQMAPPEKSGLFAKFAGAFGPVKPKPRK